MYIRTPVRLVKNLAYKLYKNLVCKLAVSFRSCSDPDVFPDVDFPCSRLVENSTS